MVIRFTFANVRLIDVVGPYGRECAYIAGHTAHKAGDECGDAETEQPGTSIACEHERKHFVVAVQARAYGVLRHKFEREHRKREQARKDDDQWNNHLEI